MSAATDTTASRFLDRIEQLVGSDGAAMLSNCEGRVVADQSGPLNFRLLVTPNKAGELFASYLQLFDHVAAPAAIIWPLRVSHGVATHTSQQRYLAIFVKLPTGQRFGILEPGKLLQWLPLTHPRVMPITLCMKDHRSEGHE